MTANLVLLLGFIVLLMAGTPVAVALGMAGLAAIFVGLDMYAVGNTATIAYTSIAKYPLIAIPLFILTGMIFERSGVAARLVRLAQAVVGPRRGGLALVAILVCLIMGGMSGSGPADAAAVATVLIPSMMKAGYPRAFSASIIAASASTAILIPPSIALIVYSIMVPGTDLRALFAAGIVPGILAGAAVALPALLLSRHHGFGAEEDAGRPPLGRSLAEALPGLLAPIIILGGLRSGLFTPTEAAVVAVAYGMIVGVFLHRTMGLRDIARVLADSASVSAVVMIIISLAGIFAWAGSTLGAFDAAAELILTLSDNAIVVLLMVMVVLLLAGMVLDGVSIYLITLPLLIPIMTTFGWNPVWFGVLMAMNIAVGQFTPPVAVNLMVTAKIAGVPIESTVRWVLWPIVAMLIAMGLVIAFPGLALWLPETMGFRI
ncbi:TRAP transporter large permease [Roseospira marina]|uniref:TRAP transporter large permease protein n=1 Tax=Roseospira marina TaxID=140057 RepID=A0A5M6IFH6_9PROT|nr:TRAP transporter large permease [Roseospira marina]KAA5607046.1 TRAP transporter large permease [Roseospira marina]MBB4312766.1 tripartite ATP-independent transporter DctM subunit [Roseospira marina]MBB5086461.1 tripartite ATP-independent transporter DctM subunit [Roseospira marina]